MPTYRADARAEQLNAIIRLSPLHCGRLLRSIAFVSSTVVQPHGRP